MVLLWEVTSVPVAHLKGQGGATLQLSGAPGCMHSVSQTFPYLLLKIWDMQHGIVTSHNGGKLSSDVRAAGCGRPSRKPSPDALQRTLQQTRTNHYAAEPRLRKKLFLKEKTTHLFCLFFFEKHLFFVFFFKRNKILFFFWGNRKNPILNCLFHHAISLFSELHNNNLLYLSWHSKLTVKKCTPSLFWQSVVGQFTPKW